MIEDTCPRIVFGFTLDVFPGNLIIGYNQFKHKLADAGVDAVVSLTALDEVPHDVSVLFVPTELAEAGRNAAPTAQLILLDTFLNHPAYPQVIAELEARVLARQSPVRQGS
jgi:PTS system mannitol-specific IIC component